MSGSRIRLDATRLLALLALFLGFSLATAFRVPATAEPAAMADDEKGKPGKPKGGKPPPKRGRPGNASKGPDQPAAPPVAAGKLTEDERRLLTLASVKYYRNQEIVFPGSPFAQLDLLLRYALIPLPSWQAELANLIVYMQDHGDEVVKSGDVRKQFFGKLGAAYGKAVVTGMGRSLLFDDKEESLQEFRRGSGADFETIADELRKSEVARARAMVRMHEAAASIAELAEANFAPRLGPQPLAADAGLVFYPHAGDAVGIPNPDGKRAWMPGWFIKIVHEGKTPLTNVVLVCRLRTLGPNIALSPGQLSALTLNQVTGFEDKVPDIKKLFIAQNCLRTMPKRFFIYVPTIQPGDVVDMPIGEADMEVAPSAALSLYADQGRLTNLPLELTKWMHRGPTEELPEVVRKGATRKEIIQKLGELDKGDRAAWLKAGKAGAAVPADAELWTWGRNEYKPKLHLAFRADRLDHYELVVPPRPKPAVAGVPLKFDSRGIATVKSAIAPSDPEHRRLHNRHKVFTANLSAGKTYAVTMSSTASMPQFEIENSYGDSLGVWGKEKKQPRPKGFPTGPLLQEVTATFTPKETGEHRIVCCWLLRSQGTGQFTLTVQPESTVVRPKPAVAGAALKLDAAGAATVKSAIAANDPRHERTGHRHKVFTVKLEADKTYAMKMTTPTETPLFEIEDRHGEETLARAHPKRPPGSPKTAEPYEANAIFKPEKDGEYRIVCFWAFPVEKFGPFTLSVQRK